MDFNKKPSTIMHIDLNSCFATVEQQANPLLRGHPIAVAAYASDNGVILAPSIEAKTLGIKLGMRVKEAKLLCPSLYVLEPDPWKYRNVHLKLRQLISTYTTDFVPKSIDEFVLNFEGYSSFQKGMFHLGQEIKQKIKQEIGDWLTVSVGIGPNRFLAKMASNLKKPDGLEEINYQNYQSVYSRLSLTDICGIKNNFAIRLNNCHIYTVLDFYNAPISTLRFAFHSIAGYYWYLRLHGWEIDDFEIIRKSYGAMYSLPKPFSTPKELSPILHKLVEKTSLRLRLDGFRCRGVHVSLLYRDHSFWHHGHLASSPLFSTADIYKRAFKIMTQSPYKTPLANLAVSIFELEKTNSTQLDFFTNINQKLNLTQALDKITEKWGNFIITPAMMLGTESLVPDRVGFGNIRDLEQFIATDV